MTSALVLAQLSRTSLACPSQWEGTTDAGEFFYARYRHGRLSWGTGNSIMAAVRASHEQRLQVTEGDDGYMEEADMLERIGAVVVRG